MMLPWQVAPRSTHLTAGTNQQQQLDQALTLIRDHLDAQRLALPKVGVILGSGLSSVLTACLAPDNPQRRAISLPYEQIPGFPNQASKTGVSGHASTFFSGISPESNVPVAVFSGRIHGYEGYCPWQVSFPVRILANLGVRVLIVTNASGGIRRDLPAGALVQITDHLNLTGQNPLTGLSFEQPNDRFVDMKQAYDPHLATLAHQVASSQNIALYRGVYAGLSGPTYETPAEVRMLAGLGGDIVGMSTVHEVITARQVGLNVLGLSCVSNPAACEGQPALNHADVVAAGKQAGSNLSRLIAGIIEALAATLSE
ncbi:MAG: purine-nucleoside phosphorylase [Vampirovibrionales bacterium]|nr:purine-nucleoside phosphorylase [Vampirovibrionales bacterium]